MKQLVFFVVAMVLLCTLASAAEMGTVLKYHDNQADGKLSLGGYGEMVEFMQPAARVIGVRIHGSLYGSAQPNEKFLIYFLSADREKILHTEMAPYALFTQGPERWVQINFTQPIELPDDFWVVLDFRATASKGVYVSYDTSSGGVHSRYGIPGGPGAAMATYKPGDWMVEVVLAQ